MKYLILLSLIFLVGCKTTVEREFPPIPPSLQVTCEDLELIPKDTDKLSEILLTVTENYNRYHICQAKVNAWLRWYNDQKEIFESAY